MLSAPLVIATVCARIENPVSSILGHEIDSKIVGFLCYWMVAGEMQILNLATAPCARRSGIAAKLLEHAFNSYSPPEIISVWLEVRSGNRAAIALYRRFGFVPNGVRRAYYRDGEDALLMVKNVLD